MRLHFNLQVGDVSHLRESQCWNFSDCIITQIPGAKGRVELVITLATPTTLQRPRKQNNFALWYNLHFPNPGPFTRVYLPGHVRNLLGGAVDGSRSCAAYTLVWTRAALGVLCSSSAEEREQSCD